MRTGTASLEYTPAGDALRFTFDYNKAMVAALKSTIPSAGRRFDWDTKVWLVAPQYEDQCRALAQTYLRVNIGAQLPFAPTGNALTTELIQVRYLGSTKDRGGDQRTASGHDGQSWRFVFPEPVLKQWFGILADDPTSESTLYAVLGIGRPSTEREIKTAFRTAARQWHPDVCTEQNATEVFQRINEAYQVLGNESLKARYDAGLKLEASLGTPAIGTRRPWRPPLRCGWLFVNGLPQLGRLVVSEILQWTEIVEGNKTLVTSWKYGGENYAERWV